MSHLETTRCDLRTRQPDMTEGWLDVTSMPPSHVMIVEDDPAISRLLAEVVKLEGFQVSTVSCAQAALEALKEHSADILLTDFKLPDRDGLSLLEQVMRGDAHTIGIIMTGFGTVDLAVKAMKLGATDILVKPFEPDQVVLLLKRVREIQRLRHENGLLKQAVVRSANVRLHSFQLEELVAERPGVAPGMPGMTGTPGDRAAYQRGIVEGERRAREQAGPVHERQQALLASAVTEFEQARATMITQFDKEVADLALAIASKILREAVEEKRDLVQRQVREAITRVRDSREVLIRVHPEDCASIESLRPALISLCEGPVTIKIEGDLRVARGGCLLETPTRLIDATIYAQFTRLGEALKRDL